MLTGYSWPGCPASPSGPPAGALWTRPSGAEGAAALREVAGDRADLLAEAVGIMLGSADGKGPEYQARARAVAEQCRLAGADVEAIPGWIEAGQERRTDTRRPPPPGPSRLKPVVMDLSAFQAHGPRWA